MSSLSLRELSVLNRKGTGFARLVTAWIQTRRTRIALSRLDGHLLKDIGIEAGIAKRESHRPFWDL